MKPEQYLKKLEKKVNDDVEKNIQRLEEKKKWYHDEKYPEDFYGCRYQMYWDKCDDEIREWENLRETFDGVKVGYPEKQKIMDAVRFSKRLIEKFSDDGNIMDDYTLRLLKRLMQYLDEIHEHAMDI